MKKTLLLGVFALLSATVAFAQSLVVTPAAGTVTSISEVELKMSDGSMLMPSSQDGADLTITDADGAVIVTISQDEMTKGSVVDEATYMPVAIKVALKNAISAEGTYTLNIPAGALYLGDNMDNNEAQTVAWTIGNTTSIAKVNVATEAIQYNILGQRVPKGQKGLMIINNKKVIVK